jgi:hypothetical protein
VLRPDDSAFPFPWTNPARLYSIYPAFAGIFRYSLREKEIIRGPKCPLNKDQESDSQKPHVTTWREASGEEFSPQARQSSISA